MSRGNPRRSAVAGVGKIARLPSMFSLLAVAGAVLLASCGDNPGNPGGGPPAGGAKTVNVNGKVVNQSGQVRAGLRVVIRSGAGFQVTTTTDASGRFTVSNVPTPYDAIVVITTARPTGATISVGLTSTTPTLLDMLGSGPSVTGPGGSASLSGKVTGGTGFPTPAHYSTSVLFSSDEFQTDQYLAASGSTGDYSTNDTYFDYNGDPRPLSWSGPTTTTGTLHALQLQEEIEYAPITFSGYGFRENVSLADGSAVSGQDIALTPVTPATLAGTYSPPTGYSAQQRVVGLRFAGGGLMLLQFDPFPTEAFSYSTPNILGATLVLVSTAYTNTYRGTAYSVLFNTNLAVDATGVATTSPPAAELISATSFSWTAVPGAVHLVVVASGASQYSAAPSYVFLTAGTSVAIPDLRSVGLNVPASTDYSWVVYGVGPYADVEAASAGLSGEHRWGYFDSIGGSPMFSNLVNSSTGGFVTVSAPEVFTTAP